MNKTNFNIVTEIELVNLLSNVQL